VSREGGDEGGKEEEKRASTTVAGVAAALLPAFRHTPLISGFLTYFCSIEPPLKKKKEIVARTLLPIHHIPTSSYFW
jgi:hypothetical protein